MPVTGHPRAASAVADSRERDARGRHMEGDSADRALIAARPSAANRSHGPADASVMPGSTSALAEPLRRSTRQVAVPDRLWPALRSDHAGETGAVYIYRGILGVARDRAVRDFAHTHLQTERRHLALMADLVPPQRRSRLLPVWRIAGWLTGALPAVFGPAAVFRTIVAVETFVDAHYRAQIDGLTDPAHAALSDILETCRRDEVAHRDDAAARLGAPGPLGGAWTAIVGHGSRLGVALAARC